MRDAWREESSRLFTDHAEEEARNRRSDRPIPGKRHKANGGVEGIERMQESKQEGGDDQPHADQQRPGRAKPLLPLDPHRRKQHLPRIAVQISGPGWVCSIHFA